MAADPTTISLTADTWTKVATDVTHGQVWVVTQNTKYVHTYRLTGGAAPTDLTDAVVLSIMAEIGASVGIDVYVRAIGVAGSVRVTL
jgi:hypothetical protein